MIMRMRLFLFSLFCNCVLFIVFFVLCKPIYNTSEDVNILYLLSGGYGNSPTELLHYNHIMHPYLGLVIKNLFVFNDSVNWYTIVLILSHFTACTIILYELFNHNSKLRMFAAYLVLFVVFECNLLMNLNFANTAIILGCAGILILSAASGNAKLKTWKIIAAILILSVASLFRIHVLIPLAGMSLPFIFFDKNRTKINTIIVIFAAALIFLLNQLHSQYYNTAIAGWHDEEEYRQKVYRFYNYRKLLREPKVNEKWYTEFNLVYNGLIVDTAFISRDKLLEMFRDLKGKYRGAHFSTPSSKPWLWINNRLFIISFVIIAIFFIRDKRIRVTTLISLILIILGLGYLLTYAKLPEYLIVSCFLLLGLLILTSVAKDSLRSTHSVYAEQIIMLLLICWGIIRLYKINSLNVRKIKEFETVYSEIARNRNSLFVITGNNFPLQQYHIFQLPRNYLLSNFIFTEHFLHQLYQPVFKRFGIKEVSDLPRHDSVLFWGKRVPALDDYFRLSTGQEVIVSPPLSSFQYGEVRRIVHKK